MDVKILSMTNTNGHTMKEYIGHLAGICYGKDDYSSNRCESCYRAGHTGVLEHVSISFFVDGISRVSANQLVRHRMASYLQESQRYVKYEFDENMFVIPPTIDKHNIDSFMLSCKADMNAYHDLIERGTKPEDARYLLPNAMKTKIVVTNNFRSLFHFFDLRLGYRAQWEIRRLAEMMFDELQKVEPDIANMYMKYRDATKID
jgi:thymidylate synthase (FAD)